MEGKDFKQLEHVIKGLEKPQLSVNKKLQMRDNLLHSIKSNSATNDYPSLLKLQEFIKAVSAKTIPSAYFKTKVKESVLCIIEKTRFQNSFLLSFARNWQKILATSMVFLISMTTFATIYIADIPITKAAPRTILLEYVGNVDVYRDDIEIEVSEGMVLMQGDIIATGKKSTAVIRYIDDSLSRLSPESELRLRKLYKDEAKKSVTEIELELNKGRVWNQVVNLSGKNSKFKVEAKDVKAETSQKASFDIKVNERQEPEVSVFENKIQVELPDDKILTKQYILEGYAIAPNNKKPEVEKIQFNSVEDEVWIEVNKEKDREYKKEIDKEKSENAKEKAGVTPESPLYPAKKINESTKLLLAGDADKTKVKIDIAVKRLNEAIVLIEGEKEAEALLNEFNGIFDEISDEVESSEELQEYLEDIIAEEEKSLSTVLPDSPKYEAKEALREAKKRIASTKEEIKEVVLDGTEEKLIEVKELIKEDKSDYVQEALQNINEDLSDVAAGDAESSEEVVTEEDIDLEDIIIVTDNLHPVVSDTAVITSI